MQSMSLSELSTMRARAPEISMQLLFSRLDVGEDKDAEVPSGPSAVSERERLDMLDPVQSITSGLCVR